MLVVDSYEHVVVIDVVIIFNFDLVERSIKTLHVCYFTRITISLFIYIFETVSSCRQIIPSSCSSVPNVC